MNMLNKRKKCGSAVACAWPYGLYLFSVQDKKFRASLCLILNH